MNGVQRILAAVDFSASSRDARVFGAAPERVHGAVATAADTIAPAA